MSQGSGKAGLQEILPNQGRSLVLPGYHVPILQGVLLMVLHVGCVCVCECVLSGREKRVETQSRGGWLSSAELSGFLLPNPADLVKHTDPWYSGLWFDPKTQETLCDPGTHLLL